MTNKQQLFVKHYITCGNARLAASKAGYKQPQVMGPRLLKVEDVKTELLKHNKELDYQIKMTLREREVILEKIATTSDPKDKIKAVDVLNKMDAVYVQKHEDVTNYDNMSDDEVVQRVAEDLIEDEKRRKVLFAVMAARGYHVSTVEPPEGMH